MLNRFEHMVWNLMESVLSGLCFVFRAEQCRTTTGGSVVFVGVLP